jgi:hypothetical protein
MLTPNGGKQLVVHQEDKTSNVAFGVDAAKRRAVSDRYRSPATRRSAHRMTVSGR